MTGRALSFRNSLDAIIVSQGNVDNPALIRSHRAQSNFAVLRSSTISRAVRNRLEFLALAVLVALNIDNNRITEANGTYRYHRHNELQRVKSFPMATNKDSHIFAADIKNQFALAALAVRVGTIPFPESPVHLER
jgi:hypothetical protein